MKPLDAFSFPESVLEDAITWQVKLLSGTATRELYAACEQWRIAHPDHNRAWQAIQQLDSRFTSVGSGNVSLVKRTLYQTQQQSHSSRRQALKILLVGGALIPAAFSGLHYYELAQPELIAATGQRRHHTLPDGSLLTLNSRSAVDVQSHPQGTIILLRRGDAYLDTRPRSLTGQFLQVQTNQWSLTLTNGEYLIHQRDQQVYVRAMTGEMEVSHPQRGTQVLRGGQEAFWLDNAGVRPYTETFFDPSGWLRGALVAKQMPAGRFLAELNRYRDGWLRCAPDVEQLPVSGVFQVADTDSVLRALEQTLPIQVKTFTPYLTSVSRV